MNRSGQGHSQLQRPSRRGQARVLHGLAGASGAERVGEGRWLGRGPEGALSAPREKFGAEWPGGI